jgi:iron complex outermembrane receptor protein
MKKKVLILIGVAFLIMPHAGWSQEQEYDLGKIVVTATRTEMEATKTPGSVSVVTKKDVEKRNIQVVDQALNTTAGVLNERGKGLMDAMATVTLRGMPKQQRRIWF